MACAGLSVSTAVCADVQKFGLGRIALEEEIAAWDLDISPDGAGLPLGSGSVEAGEAVFSDNCALCHGDFAEGIDNWPELAGGRDTLDHEDPVKTVGSYWPYLTTVLDYVRRSKPYGNAQSLTTDEVYAILAYILYSNDLVEEDFILSSDNLLAVEMPNAEGFIVDDRPNTEYPRFSGTPCMSGCKPKPAKITMRAAVLDVTPNEADTAVQDPPPDQEADLVATGEELFRSCEICHDTGDGASSKVGPDLTGIVGAPVGAVDGFRYSTPMKKLAESGAVWDEDALALFLASPGTYLKGTRMAFAGVEKQAEIAAVIAYLKSQE